MECLQNWWDALFFGLLMVVHIGSWWELRNQLALAPHNDPESRSLGATTLSSASTAGITAVSILIPASLLVVQLGSGTGAQLPPEALSYVFRAAVWFMFSLLIGLILLFIMPIRSQAHNVTRDFRTGVLLDPQLLALLVGMVWLLMGLHASINLFLPAAPS